MKNQYKRSDIFACNFQTHSKFDNRVSVYHVMRAKKCYPQGCLFFKWHCELFEKGRQCRRGYDYVGRKCSGCNHYYDEKIHYQPKILVDSADFRQFEEELEEFEDWLAEVKNTEISFWGRVDSITPQFAQTWGKSRGQVRLQGWLLKFSEGFVGTEKFMDPIYAHISPHQHERLRIAANDEFEVRARLTVDRGRILLTYLRGFDFDRRSGEVTWTNGQALVARQTATLFDGQPGKCLACRHGALVDVDERAGNRNKHRRAMYCLKGVVYPLDCYVTAAEILDGCETLRIV